MFYGRTDCFANLTSQQREEFQKIFSHEPSDQFVFRAFFGWMILPLAIADVLLIPLFLIVVAKAIHSHRVSRKCYLLLANRSVDDLLSSLVQLLCCVYVITAPHIDGERVMLLFSMYIGSFWSGMVCYVGISLLKLFAVWKPLQHKKSFTMKRVLYIIAISWIVYAAMFLYGVGGALTLTIPYFVDRWSCRAETCLRTVWRSRHYITVGVYIVILSVFFITVFIIQKSRKNAQTIKSAPSSDSMKSRSLLQRRFPLWKLGLNIATFAVCQGVYVAWNAPRLLEAFSFVVLSLTLRVFIDHILPFVTDAQLRCYLFHLLGRKLSTSSHSSGRDAIRGLSPSRPSSLPSRIPLRSEVTRFDLPSPDESGI